MKKSVEILGLPIISITEGRELGMSKTLLIDAKNGKVAAITIEDEDWYRGVKLIPYESVIAIGDDAVTITNSENIRVIGTKAITKTGSIQGKISELFIGDDGTIEKCEITAPDGTSSEVIADQISIFGKQVTVIDPTGEKKNELTPAAAHAEKAAAAPAPAAPAPQAAPKVEPPKAAPAAPQAPKAEPPKPAAAPAAKPAQAPAPAAKPEPPKAAPAPQKPAAPAAPKVDPKQAAADKATEERHRRFLLGKKATRTIKMDNGIVIVEAGQDITEEVLQKAKLANKFIELSMNVQ